MTTHRPDGRVLRVAVMGNSLGLVVPSQVAGRRDVYPQYLGDALARRLGRPVEVANESRFFGFVTNGVMDFDQVVRGGRPDVLILAYGLNEARPRTIPRTLTYWTHRLGQRDGVVSGRIRRALRDTWGGWTRLARRADRLAPVPGYMSPARFGRQLARLLYLTRRWADIPVLVLDVPPASPWVAVNVPGYERRQSRLQRVMDEIAGLRPEVRSVRFAPLVDQLGLHGLFGDAYHLAPAGHRALGELLADHVVGALGEATQQPTKTERVEAR